MRATSASDASRRASFATLRTCSMSRDMMHQSRVGTATVGAVVGGAHPPGGPRRRAGASHVDGGERLHLDRLLHAAAADALDARADALRLALNDGLDALEVRLEDAAAGAGDLLTDAAEVLRLTAVRLLVPEDGLLGANRTLHTH